MLRIESKKKIFKNKLAFRFLPLVEMTVLFMFCKIDSDTVISTEWRNLFIFLIYEFNNSVYYLSESFRFLYTFFLNLVKYAMHFTGQVKK